MKKFVIKLKIFIILFLLLSPTILNASSISHLEYKIIWRKLWGIEYKNDIGARQMAIDANNNIFICGHNGSEGIILLYDKMGNLLSEYTISFNHLIKQKAINIDEHPSPSIFRKIGQQFLSFSQKGFVDIIDIKINSITNELFILGYFQSLQGGNYTFITKYLIYNSSFHEVWTKIIENYMAYTFTIDNNSNIYIPLLSVSLFPKYILKISSDGEIVYIKHFKPFMIAIPLDIEINPVTEKIVMTTLHPKIFFPQRSKTGIIEINPKNGNIINEKWIVTPLIGTREIQWPHQAIAFSGNGNIFVSWSVVNSSAHKSKLIKLNKNLNVLFEKDLSYVITDMVVFRDKVITSGGLLSVNGSKNYGSIVYNASNGKLLFIIDLGPIINSFNPFPTNRMKAIEIDGDNNIVITGGEGTHSDSFGCVSAIETIKFILLDDENLFSILKFIKYLTSKLIPNI